jgi:hypothetical protein
MPKQEMGPKIYAYAETFLERLDFVRLALFFGKMPFLTPLSIRLQTIPNFSFVETSSFLDKLCWKDLIALLTVDL